MHPDHEPDPAVVETVISVRDRFGAGGLRDMIRLATVELTAVEEALEQLAEAVAAPGPEAGAGAPGVDVGVDVAAQPAADR